MSATTIDYNVPPLAPTGRGIYRLRNGREEMIAANTDTDEYDLWPWRIYGCDDLYGADGAINDDGSRHPRDIVALVSLAPTGPGVYEAGFGWPVTLYGRDDKGWYYCPDDTVRRDDFGRAFRSDGKSRLPNYDIVRRIGDLPAKPKVEPVVTAHNPHHEWTDEERQAAWRAVESMRAAGDFDFAAVEHRGHVCVVRPDRPSYTPEQAAAAMAALFPEPDTVQVRRDDLRGMFETTLREVDYDFHGDNPFHGDNSIDEYRSLCRVAAALGLQLPSWLENYACKQGWNGGAACD